MKTLIVAAALGATALGGIAFAAQQGATPAAPQRAMPRLDANGDGALTREELAAPLDRRFARLDADGNGQISRAEFQRRLDDRFARLDANKDGRIDASERQAMRAKWDQRRGRGMRGHGGWRHRDTGDTPPPAADNRQ